MTTPSRPRRAFWGDARFFIGIALVIISVAGVWAIVSSARRTTPMLQATRTIVEGEALASADFRVVEVSLGAAAADYLAPEQLVSGLVAARTLESGELIPASSTADAARSRSTSLVIESSTGIPHDVEAGTRIELWHSPPLPEGKGFEAPRILVGDVVVASVIQDDGVLAGDSTAVEIVVDRSDVADVLAAQTGGSALSLVPLGSGS